MTLPGVVITGIGCISAAGAGAAATRRTLYAGQRNPGPPTLFTAQTKEASPVFEVAGPLPASPGGGLTNRTTLLALAAAEEAFASAGFSPDALPPSRVGVCLGTTVGCTLNDEAFYRAFKAGQNPETSCVTRFLSNNPALYLAGHYGFTGPKATVANACSSGTDAIGLAKSWIEAGLCDMALAGGADELARITYLGFASLLVVSPQPCRPFDLNRQGLNLGEGAGLLVLESRQSAEKRGAKVLASVMGYGNASDAFHPTAPHPEGLGLKRATLAALNQAGLAPADIGCLNVHGTSTSANDAAEGKVIDEIFGSKLPFVSTKSYTGHAMGAAGGLEAVFTVMALLDQKLPASLGFETMDPQCRVAPVTSNTNLSARYGLSNSLAFGGVNSVLAFGVEA